VALLETFAEGVRSVGRPCSLVVVVPPVGVVLAGRGRWPVVAGTLTGGILGGWLFAGGWLVLEDREVRLSAGLVLVAIAVIGLGGRTPWPRLLTAPATRAAAAGVASVVAVLWWRPCVGDRLGRVLTTFPEDPWGQLAPMAAFVLGLLLPVGVAAALVGTLDRHPRFLTGAGLVGAMGVSVLASAVLVGAHEQLVSQLVRWTTT